MANYYRQASADNAPEAVLQALRNKQKIPYFHTDDDFHTLASEWQPYLHPASVLKGQETYYYAYIAESHAYECEADKIYSYQTFLDDFCSNAFK
jgi:hypothetical protein